MSYVFKSSATAQLVMLKDAAERILHIIGKHALPTGIITTEQLKDAISSLEQVIALEESRENRSHNPKDNGEEAEGWFDEQVSLKQRAWPFLEMLRTCQQANADIVWETT